MDGDSQSHFSPFIQWGTFVLHPSAQKLELWTCIYEQTQTSTLLVHFWQQLLYYRNHLVPGCWCFLIFAVLVRSLSIASLATDRHLPVSLWRLPWIHHWCFWCLSHHTRVLEKPPKATLSGWNIIYVPIFFLSKRCIFFTDIGNNWHSIGTYDFHPFLEQTEMEEFLILFRRTLWRSRVNR